MSKKDVFTKKGRKWEKKIEKRTQKVVSVEQRSKTKDEGDWKVKNHLIIGSKSG